MSGIYVFGFVASPGVREKTRSSSGALLFEANADPQIYTLTYKDIAVIVRDSSVQDFLELSKEMLVRALLHHQQVIEKFIGLGLTVIPMKLGTFVKDEAEAKTVMAGAYPLVSGMMGKISSVIEIELSVTWTDFAGILKEMGDTEEIKAAKKEALARGKGVILDDQLKIGYLVKKALDQRRSTISVRIVERLKEWNLNMKTHDILNDAMVLSAAFLLPKNDLPGFEEAINALSSGFGEKMKFRLVGPLPPYSFYTLELKRMNWEEIEWAKSKLDLSGPEATLYEIKKAYHNRALIFHPDKNIEQTGRISEFNEIKKAYSVLRLYSQACGIKGGGDRISFSQNDFARNPFLVKCVD